MFFSEIYQPGVADFDRSGKLGYEAILRIFENTASRHSDSSGDDIIEESRNGITWVLTDWRVRIVRRPDSKAPLRVTTWVRDSVPTGRIFRDYTLADESGTELVCAESRLILFDLRAQKIIRIDQQRFRSYLPETRGVFASAAPRLRAPAAFDGEKTLPLRRSDIDFNGHVHNTKYLDFALEALPDTVPRDAFTGFRMVYPKAVKDVEAGHGISYGRTYLTPDNTSTAIVPLGYADGIHRSASGFDMEGAKHVEKPGGPVRIMTTEGPKIYRVCGRVCMDQFIVDLHGSAAELGVHEGDTVELFGPGRGEDYVEPTADDWARAADTISYEIFTCLRNRIPRLYEHAAEVLPAADLAKLDPATLL